MIDSLEQLSRVVNDVVNRIVEVSTARTMSSNYYTSHDTVADLISEQDFLLYFDLIETELRGREEVLDLDVTKDHEFDAIFGTDWCPMYEDHEEGFIARPVSQPLSMARKAEILDHAMGNLQREILLAGRGKAEEAARFFGVSMEELGRLGLHVEPVQPRPPIQFQVYVEGTGYQLFPTVEEAIKAYHTVPEGVKKELFYETFREGTGVMLDSECLISWTPEKQETINTSYKNSDPHVRLAAAKVALIKDPTNKNAWNLYNEAETHVGVSGHRMSDSDLQVGNWRVHIVPPGGKYGRDDCVVNDSGKHLVEFYDLRYISPQYSPQGQFTGGRYYAETLLGDDSWSSGDFSSGLCLDASIPAWSVSGPQMKVVIEFIQEATAQKQRPSLASQIAAADKQTAGSSTKDTPGGRNDHGRI